MVIAEVRTAHMPMEVLRLDVQTEDVREQSVGRATYILGCNRIDIRVVDERCLPSSYEFILFRHTLPRFVNASGPWSCRKDIRLPTFNVKTTRADKTEQSRTSVTERPLDAMPDRRASPAVSGQAGGAENGGDRLAGQPRREDPRLDGARCGHERALSAVRDALAAGGV